MSPRVGLCLVLALGLSACGSSEASDGRLDVAASFYPLAYVAERVGGDHVDVTNLTAAGKEPHDLELSVRQTAEVAGADLVVYESELQPAVEDAVRQSAEGETLDAAAVVGLEGDDPHFWQDPLRMVKLTDAVERALVDLDPDHAADFETNAEGLTSELRRLDAAYTTGLQGCARDTIVVSHDAFGYLARYGLTMEPIVGLSPDAEPTPADLARLQTLIKREGITTVFSERLVSPRLSQTLADDLGISTAVLDPIEGLTDDTADQDYLSLMRQNLAAIEQADGC